MPSSRCAESGNCSRLQWLCVCVCWTGKDETEHKNDFIIIKKKSWEDLFDDYDHHNLAWSWSLIEMKLISYFSSFFGFRLCWLKQKNFNPPSRFLGSWLSFRPKKVFPYFHLSIWMPTHTHTYCNVREFVFWFYGCEIRFYTFKTWTKIFDR